MIPLPVPVPGASGIQSWAIVQIVNFLLDYLFGSPADTMKGMVKTVSEARHADLTVDWFKTVYGDVAGLAIILGLLGMVVFAFAAVAQPHKPHRWMEFAMNILKLWGVIAFTPTGVAFAIYLSTKLVAELDKLGNSLITGDGWSSSLTTSYTFGDIVGGGMIRFVTQIGAMSIRLAISPQELLEYALMTFGVLAYIWSKTINPESRLNRITWTLLMTVLAAQPVVVLVLVVGGVFISRQQAPAPTKAIEVMALSLLCLGIVIGLFVGAKHQVTRVIKSKVDVEGNVRVDGEVTAEDVEADAAEQRAMHDETQQVTANEALEVTADVGTTQTGEASPEGDLPAATTATAAEAAAASAGDSSVNPVHRPVVADSESTDSTSSRGGVDRVMEYAGTAAKVATAAGHPEAAGAIVTAQHGYNFFIDRKE